MDAAIEYKRTHPLVSYSKVAHMFGINPKTFHDQATGKHAARGVTTRRNLSAAQEVALVHKINMYAAKGTMLSPRHIKSLAAAVSEGQIWKNWTANFMRRHVDILHLGFSHVQETARFKADTVENRQRFYALGESMNLDQYAPGNIYNMDEAGFTLLSSQKVRKVGPVDASSKSQSALADDVHITLIGTISTVDAPVPPFLIYPGATFQDEWATV